MEVQEELGQLRQGNDKEIGGQLQRFLEVVGSRYVMKIKLIEFSDSELWKTEVRKESRDFSLSNWVNTGIIHNAWEES